MAEQQKDGRQQKPRKSAATLLVEIAERLYTFSSVAGERGGQVILRCFATPQGQDAGRIPLQDIRPSLSMEYQFENDGKVPSGAQLSAAMTALQGNAESHRVARDEDEGEEILQAAGLVPVPADRGLSLITNRDDCPLPEGYRIPLPYVAAADGIYQARDDGSQPRVTWDWLFPVRIYVDPAGDQMVELAWRDHGRWTSRLVRRAVAKSGRKLVAEFGDAGLPVIEAEARQVERWLASAESANRKVIGRDQVARQLGWQSDGRIFVAGQGAPQRVEPAYPDQAGPLKAHHPKGSLSAWKAVIEGAGEYIVVRAGVITSLAAPLLEVLGLDSFAEDISGESTRGKSITVMAAMSCWADPSDKADAMLSWRVPSIFPIEKRLNLVNGLPVVIDETRLVKDPALIDTVLYLLPKNHGQPRGGGWPNMIPWRTILLMTGERPALSFVTDQGASARILSITQHPPFGPESSEGRDAAEALKKGVETNYGLAGPAFVAQLQDALTDERGAEKLCIRHDELTALLRGDSDMSGRRAPLIACLALASELACKWDILPAGMEIPPEQWLDLFTTPDMTDNRPEMALDVIREFVAARSGDLWAPGRDWQPSQGWIGRYCKLKVKDETTGAESEVPTVALLPRRLSDELKRNRIDYAAVLPGWRGAKYLHESGTGRAPYELPRRLGPTKPRMLVFAPGVIEIEYPADRGRDGAPPPDAPMPGGDE